MENKKLLIVGIDPGTTIGYAILDIDGNLLYLNSSKQFDLNKLISQSLEFGKTLLVGTDKAKVPRLVEAFATKLGARVVNPSEDLKVEDKKRMVDNFSFEDEHQSDALASALFAYKETKSLLDKIDVFVKNYKKHSIKDRIKEIVVTKRISIKSAVSIIEKKDEEGIIMDNVLVEKKLSENDFLELYDKLKRYESDLKLLKKYNNSLKGRVKNLEREGKPERPRNENKQAEFREQRIRFLENMAKSKEKEIEDLKSVVKKFNNLLANINNYYILKKLDTLGFNQFNFKDKILNIQKNDILLVDDPNIISDNVVGFLKDNITVIIHKKPVSRKIMEELPFVFIEAQNLKIIEDKYFGFIDKSNFEIEKNKINWAKKIIDNYKKEKQLVSR